LYIYIYDLLIAAVGDNWLSVFVLFCDIFSMVKLYSMIRQYIYLSVLCRVCVNNACLISSQYI